MGQTASWGHVPGGRVPGSVPQTWPHRARRLRLPLRGRRGFHDFEDAWEEGFQLDGAPQALYDGHDGAVPGRALPVAPAGFRSRAGRAAARLAPPPTTARPPARPIRLEEAAAGVHFAARSSEQPCTSANLELGARHGMEPAAGGVREQYGDPTAEYWAVPDARVSDHGRQHARASSSSHGPDAVEFLERLLSVPRSRTSPEGGIRYALFLNEDGLRRSTTALICPLGAGQPIYFTFTSGGARAGRGDG